MKTVMDAVNEFMGEWRIVYQDNDEQLALYLTSHNPRYPNDKKGEIYKGFTGFSEDKYLQVCTRKEFLAAVAECENNFGQCDYTYADHNIAWTHAPSKPLTPPDKLIDGKAYQFELNGLLALGFYGKNSESFFSCGNRVCGLSECDEIQPLTVEFK